ncbi:hypothetical protein [Streptomyces specialis]|uniref:hypothetical protein n=1 Tax=Streptomyces specialis TaxID=498367 RepID=UPI00073E7667|nr:hypothetical protein [Streptomyces specialis]
MNGTVRPHRASGVTRRRLAWLLSLMMVASLLQALTLPSAIAADSDDFGSHLSDEEPVGGRDGIPVEPRPEEETPRIPQEEPRGAWPEPGTGAVRLTGEPATAQSARSGELPVRLAADEPADTTAEVRVLDQDASAAAGVEGVLLTVQRRDGSRGRPEGVDVELAYGDFAGAYGGGYGSRLTFYELPSCVLRTPDEPECREATPVTSRNDTERETLTASDLRLAGGRPGGAGGRGRRAGRRERLHRHRTGALLDLGRRPEHG